MNNQDFYFRVNDIKFLNNYNYVKIKELHKENLNRITEINRSEMDEENIHLLRERGPLFDKDKLVGVAVLGGVFIGEKLVQLQMAFLYTSNGFRKKGIGKMLIVKVSQISKELGANKLYIYLLLKPVKQ